MSRVFVVSLGMLILCSVPLYGDCPHRIPEYVRMGGQGMVLTEEAEEVLCRDEEILEALSGHIEDVGQKVLIEDKVVRAEQVRDLLRRNGDVEFVRCLFPEEVYLEGPISSKVAFRQSEFRGNVDFHSARLGGEMQFVSVVFHQGFHVADSVLSEPLTIVGSVLAGGMEIERTLLRGGGRVLGSRINGDFNASGLRSPVGLTFEDVRFVGSVGISEPEIVGGIRFRGCEWDQTALISLSKGTVGGGLRFDSCGFDARWLDGSRDEYPLIRLSDLTVGASVVIADATSRRFPRLAVSRCVITFLKLPEWKIARDMVLREWEGDDDPRDMEEAGELLQLVRSSYESQGRTRDASAVRSEHRILVARITNGPVLWMRRARDYFGTGLWWFLGTIGFFALLLGLQGKKWNIHEEGSGRLARAYRVLDLSVGGFFKGPPRGDDGGVSLASNAKTALMIERIIGIIFLFFFTVLLNEWIQG